MYKCLQAQIFAAVFAFKGWTHPAAFISSPTAIKHLCLALLLVATVTKAQSGVAAAAIQEKKKKKIYPGGANHNNRLGKVFQNRKIRSNKLAKCQYFNDESQPNPTNVAHTNKKYELIPMQEQSRA